MSESTERLEPWTVRDALILLDKKNNALEDHFHQTQAMVQAFEVIVKSLDNRINNGLSPTMQKVKDQNVEIEKSIIRLEGNLERTAQDVRNSISIVAGKVTEFENDRDKLKDMARSVIVKISVAAIVSVAGMFFTTWTMVRNLQARLDRDTAAIYMKTADSHRKP